jgi:hypothetical protein
MIKQSIVMIAILKEEKVDGVLLVMAELLKKTILISVTINIQMNLAELRKTEG